MTTGGTCQTGTAKTVCGNNGSVCGDCNTNQNGKLCTVVTGGGQCGCSAIGDCPGTSTACTSSLCVNTCSGAMPCLSGCCASTTSTCQPGTSQTVCGAPGSACQSCLGNANGSACLTSGVCGCTKTSDCAANHACDTSIGRCTTSCNTNQPCNGGCCASGSCAAGNVVGACGSSGNLCATCPGSTFCATYSCDGTMCKAMFTPAGTVCTPADPSNCLFAAECNGASASCPARLNMCSGNGCCTSPNHCTDPCP